MMSAGKIVLLFTIVLNVSVPCFGAGLFLMPTTFWNSGSKSNQIQYSAQEETRDPESIEAQIEEPIAYELKMEKPLEGKIQIPYNPKKLSLEEEPTLCGLFGFRPSSIYCWSISHILEHELFCLGRLGSSGQ